MAYCNFPHQYLGSAKDCNVQAIVGILYSPVQISLTDEEVQVFSNIDALLSAPLGVQMQFLKFTMPIEVTSKENVVSAGLNGIETKTSYNAPKLMGKIESMTPDQAGRFLSEFGNGRKGFYAPVYAQGAVDYIRNASGTIGLAPCKVHETEEFATETTTRTEGVSLQPLNYEVYKKIVVRVFDKTYNSTSDYYALTDFYATTPASTTVSDGGLPTITFNATSSDGVALSGYVQADIGQILIGGVDELSNMASAVETPAGSGTYLITGTASFSAGSATVIMNAQSDLSVSGFAFTEANAGVLA